jgi:hypothetical protein
LIEGLASPPPPPVDIPITLLLVQTRRPGKPRPLRLLTI